MLLEKVANQEKALEIHTDEMPFDPREWDNLGTMVCFDREYDLGDKKYSSVEAFLERLCLDELGIDFEEEIDPDTSTYREDLWRLAEKHIISLPLYLYKHSGITMNTKGFRCPWDSGQVGWIYVTKDRVRAEFGEITEEVKNKVKRILRAEVEVYDSYIMGQVYGYILKEVEICPECGAKNEEVLDSCWGFYGIDGLQSMREDYLSDEKELLDGLSFV